MRQRLELDQLRDANANELSRLETRLRMEFCVALTRAKMEMLMHATMGFGIFVLVAMWSSIILKALSR
jgi:hypothetical protein